MVPTNCLDKVISYDVITSYNKNNLGNTEQMGTQVIESKQLKVNALRNRLKMIRTLIIHSEQYNMNTLRLERDERETSEAIKKLEDPVSFLKMIFN